MPILELQTGLLEHHLPLKSFARIEPRACLRETLLVCNDTQCLPGHRIEFE